MYIGAGGGGGGIDLPVMWVMFSTGKDMQPSLIIKNTDDFQDLSTYVVGSSHAPVISVVSPSVLRV
jgi:hypothetical protein